MPGACWRTTRQQTLLKQQYDTVRTEQAAVDLFGRYRTVANLGRVLRDSLTWLYGDMVL